MCDYGNMNRIECKSVNVTKLNYKRASYTSVSDFMLSPWVEHTISSSKYVELGVH